MKRPLSDRVIVEPNETLEETASGIVIPEGAKEKPCTGVVAAVGNGKDGQPMTVKAGDVVTYGRFAGQELTIDDKVYLIMRESEILAVD